jgi:hypothetical protein
MGKQSKIDLEIKAIDTQILFGFELYCSKLNKTSRSLLIDYMKTIVDLAIKKGELSMDEIENYNPIIEEY